MLGQGEESKEWLSIPGHSTDKLFLSHVTKVAKGIRETYPSLSVIMWDDMLRNMTTDTIKGELTLYSFVLLISTQERTALERNCKLGELAFSITMRLSYAIFLH